MIDMAALAQSLFERRRTAVVIPYRESSLPEWKPSEHLCHINADYWSIHTHGDMPVRGWLVFDLSSAMIFGQRPRFRFTAHSVNIDENGNLFDLTPSQASQRYPFIRHQGSDEEFMTLVENHKIVHVEHFLT